MCTGPVVHYTVWVAFAILAKNVGNLPSKLLCSNNQLSHKLADASLSPLNRLMWALNLSRSAEIGLCMLP